jgi:hypothetical protein
VVRYDTPRHEARRPLYSEVVYDHVNISIHRSHRLCLLYPCYKTAPVPTETIANPSPCLLGTSGSLATAGHQYNNCFGYRRRLGLVQACKLQTIIDAIWCPFAVSFCDIRPRWLPPTTSLQSHRGQIVSDLKTTRCREVTWRLLGYMLTWSKPDSIHKMPSHLMGF